VVITVLVAPLVTLASVTTAYAEATLPSGFEDLVSVGGLHQPTRGLSLRGRIAPTH